MASALSALEHTVGTAIVPKMSLMFLNISLHKRKKKSIHVVDLYKRESELSPGHPIESTIQILIKNSHQIIFKIPIQIMTNLTGYKTA